MEKPQEIKILEEWFKERQGLGSGKVTITPYASNAPWFKLFASRACANGHYNLKEHKFEMTPQEGIDIINSIIW